MVAIPVTVVLSFPKRSMGWISWHPIRFRMQKAYSSSRLKRRSKSSIGTSSVTEGFPSIMRAMM